MSRAVVEVPDSVGGDTNAKVTTAMARALAGASWNGRPFSFLLRYVGLHGPTPGDIDAAELDGILSAGLLLGLVQHVRLPGWPASAAAGQATGHAAVTCARAAGYVEGAHLAFDLEGCASVGQAVIDHVEAWCDVVSGEGYAPLLYVGYAAGLTPTQLYESLPGVHAYWSDYGPRAVDRRGFCLRQHAQTTIAGVQVDPDEAFADSLGGRLLLMGDVSTSPTDPAPAA